MKPTSTLCEQNAEFQYVKAGAHIVALVDLLLGNNPKTSNYTTAIAKLTSPQTSMFPR
jgi:hypothetical protein